MTFAVEWPAMYPDGERCAALASLSDSQAAVFEEMAAEYLWRHTGRRFGLVEGVLRPCRQDLTTGLSTYGPPPGSAGPPWAPALVGGRWLNVGCGAGHPECGCSRGSVLRFDTGVHDVAAVEVDGADLDRSAWRVDDGLLLVRQDGGTWPYCQDLSRPLGQEGTWAVTVVLGSPVPVGGQFAAGKLACELARAAAGDSKCELPQRWQSVTRQGVSITAALDTFEGLDEGRTGIWLVDSWVASVTKPDIGFSVASPDLRPAGRRRVPVGSYPAPPPAPGGSSWNGGTP